MLSPFKWLFNRAWAFPRAQVANVSRATWLKRMAQKRFGVARCTAGTSASTTWRCHGGDGRRLRRCTSSLGRTFLGAQKEFCFAQKIIRWCHRWCIFANLAKVELVFNCFGLGVGIWSSQEGGNSEPTTGDLTTNWLWGHRQMGNGSAMGPLVHHFDPSLPCLLSRTGIYHHAYIFFDRDKIDKSSCFCWYPFLGRSPHHWGLVFRIFRIFRWNGDEIRVQNCKCSAAEKPGIPGVSCGSSLDAWKQLLINLFLRCAQFSGTFLLVLSVSDRKKAAAVGLGT